MTTQSLDGLAAFIKERAQQKDAFAAKYGHQATAFLDELPGLFQLYRRVPFDLDIPVDARRLSASVALYLAEHQDFLPDKSGGAEPGLIDDVWVAYRGLSLLVKKAGGPALARHWRGTVGFDELQGLAANAVSLEDKVPSKVLEAAHRYLDLEP